MVDLCLYQVKMNLYRTFCEVEMSTKSDLCHYLGSGTFDFTLGQHLSFDSKHKVYIGVKNVKWPEKIRNMDIRIALTKLVSEFDETQLQKHFIGFRSYEEFSDVIQYHANQSLEENPNMALENTLAFKVVVHYRNNRFLMDIHHDLMLVVSKNVASVFGFDGEDVGTDYVAFKKNAYICDDYRYFSSSRKNKMCLVVYDIIKEYCVTADGNRFSVLFNYEKNDNHNCNELLGVKQLVKRDELKQFRFCILDEDLKPFEECVYNRHLKFTLVFFTF